MDPQIAMDPLADPTRAISDEELVHVYDALGELFEMESVHSSTSPTASNGFYAPTSEVYCEEVSQPVDARATFRAALHRRVEFAVGCIVEFSGNGIPGNFCPITLHTNCEKYTITTRHLLEMFYGPQVMATSTDDLALFCGYDSPDTDAQRNLCAVFYAMRGFYSFIPDLSVTPDRLKLINALVDNGMSALERALPVPTPEKMPRPLLTLFDILPALITDASLTRFLGSNTSWKCMVFYVVSPKMANFAFCDLVASHMLRSPQSHADFVYIKSICNRNYVGRTRNTCRRNRSRMPTVTRARANANQDKVFTPRSLALNWLRMGGTRTDVAWELHRFLPIMLPAGAKSVPLIDALEDYFIRLTLLTYGSDKMFEQKLNLMPDRTTLTIGPDTESVQHQSWARSISDVLDDFSSAIGHPFGTWMKMLSNPAIVDLEMVNGNFTLPGHSMKVQIDEIYLGTGPQPTFGFGDMQGSFENGV